MASQKPRRQAGDLTKRSRDRIASEGEKYGLTRRQSFARYNRGTYNPLSKDPLKQIPQHAPLYPLNAGEALRDAAKANVDTAFDLDDPFAIAERGVNSDTIYEVIDHHASESLLRKLATGSPEELKSLAKWQASKSDPGKPQRGTPKEVRDAGWIDSDGKWHSAYWYH